MLVENDLQGLLVSVKSHISNKHSARAQEAIVSMLLIFKNNTHVTHVIKNRPRCVKIEYLIFMQKDKITLGAEL